jgi:hypothetical protein
MLSNIKAYNNKTKQNRVIMALFILCIVYKKMSTIPSFETILVQCNRTNSIVHNDNPDLNGQWITSLDTGGLELKKGDVVSVENVCLNLPLANPDQAMEFRNGFALKDWRQMPYSENKILIEFGYTVNNNKPPIGGGYSCLYQYYSHNFNTTARIQCE